MTLTLYGLRQCSTCVKARDWLNEHAIAHTFIDYREQPVAATVLRDWATQLGGWEKLVNRASMTWRNLADAQKSPADDAAWLALIAQYPALIRRPVAVDASGAVGVGFSARRYQQRFA